MSREIKFRAWNTESKAWANPLTFVIDGGGNMFDHAGHKSSKNYVLSQYTGLKDKNGKDVYEGDILTAYPKVTKEDTFKREVVWHGDGFYLREVGDTKSLTTRLAEVNLKMEVVGNIWES